MKTFIKIAVLSFSLAVAGCVTTPVEPKDNGNVPVANPQAERQLEEHDTWIPWWN